MTQFYSLQWNQSCKAVYQFRIKRLHPCVNTKVLQKEKKAHESFQNSIASSIATFCCHTASYGILQPMVATINTLVLFA